MGIISKHIILFLICNILAVFIPTNYVSAQESDKISEMLILANSALDRTDPDSAEYYYEKILEIDENYIPAIAGLGKVAYLEKDWGNVLSYFEDVAEADSNSIEAYYYMGIAYRERAKSKVLWLRWWDFEDAAENFDKVIARDSLYRDIFYQYAYLRRCEEKYPESIPLSQKQLQLKPDSVELYIQNYDLYMNFIRNESREDFERWADSSTYPEARLFTAELYRRHEEYRQALKILNELELGNSTLPIQLIQRSFIRIYYERGDALLAEKYYNDAVDSIKDKLGAAILFEDLKYIISSGDYNYYKNIESAEELRFFFKKFWSARDPLPASKHNERLKEHYNRLAYAEDNYEFDGFRTWFNNPDKYHELKFPLAYYLNHEFNDKGLIYVRYGRADEWVITAESSLRNESWKYNATSTTPSMLFHFLNETAGYNWRLAPYVLDEKLIEDRLSIDPLAYRMYVSDNQLDQESIRFEMLEQSNTDVSTVFETEKSTWIKETKPLNFYIDLAMFRGDSDMTVSELYYYIPGNQFPQSDVPSDMVIECGLSITDSLYRVVHEERKNISIRGVGNPNTAWIDFFRVNLDPGNYNFGIHIKGKGKNLLGAYKFSSSIENFHKPFLSMSSVYKTNMVSSARQEGISVSRGVLIKPNPSNFFNINQPLYLFFELYNLTYGQDDSTDYRIEITAEPVEKEDNIFDDIAGLFGSSDSGAVLFDKEKSSGRSSLQEMITLSIKDLDPGAYKLQIKVTDNLLKVHKIRTEHVDLYESDQ